MAGAHTPVLPACLILSSAEATMPPHLGAICHRWSQAVTPWAQHGSQRAGDREVTRSWEQGCGWVREGAWPGEGGSGLGCHRPVSPQRPGEHQRAPSAGAGPGTGTAQGRGGPAALELQGAQEDPGPVPKWQRPPAMHPLDPQPRRVAAQACSSPHGLLVSSPIRL